MLKQDDVVMLACDLEGMHMCMSVNGSFAAPNGWSTSFHKMPWATASLPPFLVV